MKTQKQPRLTVTEKRALSYCESLKAHNGGSVSVDWAKSQTWGSNPRILHYGEKCSNISGCGYDKLSACLAEVLRFLFPRDSEAHDAVWGKAGAGDRSVIAELAKHGWKLTPEVSGKSYDVYHLSRI